MMGGMQRGGMMGGGMMRGGMPGMMGMAGNGFGAAAPFMGGGGRGIPQGPRGGMMGGGMGGGRGGNMMGGGGGMGMNF